MSFLLKSAIGYHTLGIFVLIMQIVCRPSAAQSASTTRLVASQNQASQSADHTSATNSQSDGENELRQGTKLTREGSFAKAIPHLLAARGRVANEYAANFNLALCYIGTNQFQPAIEVLTSLRSDGNNGADVENLLAQAYIGNLQPGQALAALQAAAQSTPQNEKLYAFVADACNDHRQYRLGLRVVDIGLHNLPQSARLHYERAMFLAQLDNLDQAKQDFKLASRLAPESEIGILASAHEYLLVGNIGEAVRTARLGVNKGFENPALLTVLGEALIRNGASPGQADFKEAQTALATAVREQPNDVASRIALGSADLTTGQVENAILHLEKARQLDPGNPAVYSNLAKAYQRSGDTQKAHDALAALQTLNAQQAARINSAPGDRKSGYASPNLAKPDAASDNP